MNKVVLIGRLTKDIELRYTQTNKAVAQTTIAVNRPGKEDGSQEADFINLVIWGKQAENLSKYCGKGSQIAIDGRIQTRSYDDQNGQKRYVTEVVSDNVQFLDSKKETTQAKEETKLSRDPFAEFGQEIERETTQMTTDYDLPF